MRCVLEPALALSLVGAWLQLDRSCIRGLNRVRRASRAPQPSAPRTPTLLGSRPRAIVCLSGVVARSIQVTWPSVDTRVLRVLRARGYEVDVHVLNLDVGSSMVDGVPLNQSDVSVVPATSVESLLQSAADAEVDARCADRTCPSFSHSGMSKKGNPRAYRNSLRQHLTESRVGDYLERTRAAAKYDLAMAVSADYFLANDLRLAEVEQLLRRPDLVATGVVQDGRGFTDGLYFGQVKPVTAVLRRWHDRSLCSRTYHSNEEMLRAAFELLGFERLPSALWFYKVRANGHVWAGPMALGFLPSARDRREVRDAHAKAEQGGRWLRLRRVPASTS